MYNFSLSFRPSSEKWHDGVSWDVSFRRHLYKIMHSTFVTLLSLLILLKHSDSLGFSDDSDLATYVTVRLFFFLWFRKEMNPCVFFAGLTGTSCETAPRNKSSVL